MKNVFICTAIALATSFGAHTYAQSLNAQPGGDKEYNIFYAQDIPYTTIKQYDAKLVALDKQFKAYETAINNDDTKKAEALKANIDKWYTDNISWIEQLDAHLVSAVKNFYNNSVHSLRLFDLKRK